MSIINNIKNIINKHPFFSLFIIHTVFVVLFVLFLSIFLHMPDKFFLEDDGYYYIGKNYFYGNSSLWYHYRVPGIPLILSSLNIFPVFLHPYLRILISQLLTLLNIYLAVKIFKRFLPLKVIFWGLVISLFNPVYLWWACLRSSPEIYVTVFLGLIILASLGLAEKNKKYSLLSLIILIPLSLLFKPVLFLIPFFLIVYFLLQKKYKLVLSLFVIFLITLFSLGGIMKLTKPKSGLGYGVISLMFDTYFTESLLKTHQLGYNRGSGDFPEKNSSTEYIYIKMDEWMNNYQREHSNLDPMEMNITFIKEKYDIILISKLLNPVYFISITDTDNETIIMFIINTVILYFSVINLKKVKAKFGIQIGIIIFIFIGFYSVYFLTTSIARYSIPLLFYISVFSGMSLVNLSKKNKVQKNVQKVDGQNSLFL